jgi:voltage-gated potassium channel
MSSVFFHALRRMRAPLIAIVVIYAVSVLGLVLIPGITAEGNPAPPMSFLHAFYFMSYTATTIGFGEIPAAFSAGQRLWVTVCIYLSVFGWSYLIVGLLALFQDKGILQALAINRFKRSVNRIGEPFYIICGYGETGALLARALDWLEIRFVVIDIAEERINELALEDFSVHVPTLVADARSPQTLRRAGLHHPKCLGVVSLTNDDGANLAVAITVRLLNPGVQVLARAQSERTVANMMSFGTNHIINPFEKFGEYLALALDEPGCYQLLEWLTGIPGTTLRAETAPPRGHWVVCGYGRFGRAVVRHLGREGLAVTIIDPDESLAGELPMVVGEGTDTQSLRQAGLERAVGIVAGTDNDVNNLSIAMIARQTNPNLFVVIRQNLVASKVLFSAFNANVTMISSEIIAHECLAVLTTPLLSRFLGMVKRESDAWADSVVDRLKARVGETVPEVWSVRVDSVSAPAFIQAGLPAPLDLLLRRGPEREVPLSCLALMLVRNEHEQPLPEPSTELALGDELLFAGTRQARVLQALTLKNMNVLSYVKSGHNIPGGWVWRNLSRRLRSVTGAAGVR